MKKVKPFIKCVDFWPEHIPEEKLAAYKQLIEEGQILKHHVIYNRGTKSTTVEYFAIAPREWILEELKKRSEAYGHGTIRPDDVEKIRHPEARGTSTGAGIGEEAGHPSHEAQ